jgi:hypothetical protein
MSDPFGNAMWTMYGAGAPCNSGSGSTTVTCAPGGPASLERVRFFQRQLITAADLNQVQDYLRAQNRRHNRMMHGWGVVCGCEVSPGKDDYTVVIQPGYVLGPQGDEIVVDGPLTVDLRREGLDGNAAGSCMDVNDPWCSGVQVERHAGTPLYLAVAYAECPSHPVRVQPAGCGCDDGNCEYSRIRDGFAIRVLENLPTSHAGLANKPPGLTSCPRPCPDCVTEPWVVLARIDLHGKTIVPKDIDNFTYRRYAVSFANIWFQCGEKPATAATFKVAALRFVATGESESNPNPTVVAELTDPSKPLEVPQTEGLNAIDVQFVMDPADPIAPSSVVADTTFIAEVVGPGGARQVFPGRIVQVSGDTFRWLPGQQHGAAIHGMVAVGAAATNQIRITLKGTDPAIHTQTDVPLDGEPTTQLPSGDNTPGGDFVVTAVVVQNQ